MTHLTAIVLILGLCLSQVLIAGVVLEAGEIDRLKETIDTLSVKKENQSRRIVGKLAGGVLGGALFALVGGAIGINVGEDETYDPFVNSLISGWVGYLVGVPAGMSVFDPYDQFKYSLVGSLIGGAVSLPLLYIEEDLWPALFIAPFVSAAIMSEFSRKPPKDRSVSIGLLPGPNGRVSAVATLRF
ncbi:MAG: hypothetical protein OXH16_07425 [Gemmatimonadetes bacterium]|nr:hypothetical protein [Gemmatimonadota bacterium]